MIAAANHFEDYENYGCQIFVSVDAPNLEELDIYYDFLVSCSLKNTKCLRKVKIDFLDVKQLVDREYFLGLADRICQLFADICNAKYLTVSAPILVALGDGYQRLPTFNDLNHLELQLQTCRYRVQFNSLIFNHVWDYKYCDDDNEDVLVHEWGAPEFANICLVSHLKTICLWDFKGCPNDMEVAKYLVKHGKALNRVTIHTHFSENKEMKSRSPTALWSKFSKFPRGSKTCEIEFRIII
ncbi:FBD-associated F-box protein At5g22730-like [Rosa chinensis]|uniref:FBD-associated F-box protein At5g22730-like n=1 Tax=Rosa chinensis TaxID=74649 RepID=UPI001AD8CF83|nr:FBD-associated F-box protein At5g22730-like [Rosa chinensis]